ncbi:hypothetical protein [Nocardia sp. NPDC052566]|uniref:hypothetical protein n=1 Tax=Nocardia sp. NPDC052566 TaxID=3364330 RepID=UPI0037C56489
MNAQVDPSIVDLLRGSALAPLIDRPVNDILKDMGLPQLPQINGLPPLPDMPPLPVIDLAALTRPITDLASSFGTGVLNTSANANPGAGGAPVDPTQALTGITQALQTAMTVGTSALQVLMSLWQGMGANQAAGKAGQAAANGADLATQSVGEKAVLGGAATSVGVGAALMAAIVAKYMTQMAIAAPMAGAPGGQLFIVAATAETITEALATVAKTRIELTGHSANMTATGRKVPVTKPPKGLAGGGADQGMQQLMQMLTPLMTMAQTGVQSATQLAQSQAMLAKEQAARDKDRETKEKEDRERERNGLEHDAKGGVGGKLGGVGAVGGIAPAQAPLSPWSGTRAAGSLPGAASMGQGSPAVEPTMMRSAPVGSSASPGMMPIGGAGGGLLGARAAGDAGAHPEFLVNAQHGDEVVGNLDGVSLPVVGAAEHVTEPPPDKELTL